MGERAGLTLLGWGATYVANVVRVFSIILILHFMGKRSVFIAHTVFGRIIFFVLVAAIYWLVFTKGTIRTLAERLQARMRS